MMLQGNKMMDNSRWSNEDKVMQNRVKSLQSLD